MEINLINLINELNFILPKLNKVFHKSSCYLNFYLTQKPFQLILNIIN